MRLDIDVLRDVLLYLETALKVERIDGRMVSSSIDPYEIKSDGRFKKHSKGYCDMDILNWLQEWYKSNCDGDWEHVFGIKIDTLDNPGFTVCINLEGTNLEGKDFKKMAIDNGDDDWLFCWVENVVFNGVGDPNKLGKILEIFRDWADMQEK